MKRSGRPFLTILLVFTVVMCSFWAYVNMAGKIPGVFPKFLKETEQVAVLPADGRQVIVRSFDFASEQDLNGWDEKLLASNNTHYDIEETGGEGAIKAVSENSASALLYKQPLSYDRNPFVSWAWKVDKFPDFTEPENLHRKKEFDFAAQFYVIFYSRYFLKTKAIQYVWTRDIAAGTVTDSPYTKNVKIKVLESGPSEGWKQEYRDIRGDFEEMFGEELDKDVAAIAFMTDSDSTDTSAVAYFSNIRMGYILNGEPGKTVSGETVMTESS